jgi:hypothetical protein
VFERPDRPQNVRSSVKGVRDGVEVIREEVPIFVQREYR